MFKLVDLSNKHIVITGASSGIGREVALLVNKLGAKVSLIGRKKDLLESLIQDLQVGENQFYEFDVTNFNDIDNLVSRIVATNGLIDGFVHSAGIEMTRPLKMLKIEHYREVFDINTISALEITKSITKNTNISTNASIIYISSIVGILGQPGKTAYSASKGALIAAAKCLALELAPKGIRVNTILPALVETDMSSKILASLSEEGKNNIIEDLKSNLPKKQKENATIQDIELIIKAYLNDLPFTQKEFSLSQMSFDLKIPERFLSNYFNKELEITFSDWRKNLRIDHVCRLIEVGEAKNLTIEAIATNAGFASRSKFIDAFKERKGVTPSAFIKSIKSVEA
jgi:NAD(P)-dependent dehydrogenase (short-subunit alcohol dehydrogenase family)